MYFIANFIFKNDLAVACQKHPVLLVLIQEQCYGHIRPRFTFTSLQHFEPLLHCPEAHTPVFENDVLFNTSLEIPEIPDAIEQHNQRTIRGRRHGGPTNEFRQLFDAWFIFILLGW